MGHISTILCAECLVLTLSNRQSTKLMLTPLPLWLWILYFGAQELLTVTGALCLGGYR